MTAQTITSAVNAGYLCMCDATNRKRQRRQ